MSDEQEKKKEAGGSAPRASGGNELGKIANAAELKEFLLNVRDKMTDKSAAPIYAMSAMNFLLRLPNIYRLLDKDNKEIARDIWLRLKQSGLQLRNPPLLFSPEEEDLASPGN